MVKPQNEFALYSAGNADDILTKSAQDVFGDNQRHQLVLKPRITKLS